MQYILHLCQRVDWVNAQRLGEYYAASLTAEGFIHCSTPEQILQVANIFYRSTLDLVVLWINRDCVKAEIKWESVGKEKFPHIIGPLNLDAICAVSELKPDLDGVYRTLPLPDDLK